MTADVSGTLINGSASLPFTNALESGKLRITGDKLDGAVAVTGSASQFGAYSGTINFLISYFAG